MSSDSKESPARKPRSVAKFSASSINKQEKRTGRWWPDENLLFLYGLKAYGKDWKKIRTLVPTRSLVQISVHGNLVAKRMDAGEDVFAPLEENAAYINMLLATMTAPSVETSSGKASSQAATTQQTTQEKRTGRWWPDERLLFLYGLKEHGRNWKKISTLITTRTTHQIAVHGTLVCKRLDNGEDVFSPLEGNDAYIQMLLATNPKDYTTTTSWPSDVMLNVPVAVLPQTAAAVPLAPRIETTTTMTQEETTTTEEKPKTRSLPTRRSKRTKKEA